MDVDGERELAARLDVRSIPTLLMWSDGQVVGQVVGAVPRAQIEGLVESRAGGAGQPAAGGLTAGTGA